MVGRNIVRRVRPLRIAGRGEGEDCKGPDPTGFEKVLHEGASTPILRQSWSVWDWSGCRSWVVRLKK